MGLLKDFKEFIDYKRNKSFYTNQLYIAQLGTIYVAANENKEYKTAEFDFDRYVIVTKATGKEVRKHLIEKYGSYCGEPNIFFRDANFEKPENTTYYKLITRNNQILPSATPSSIINNASQGVYEVVCQAKSLNSTFSETIDLNSITQLEKKFNNEPDFII